MKKTLDSGLEVESDIFYRLLVWKEEERVKFRSFLKQNPLAPECLNLMNSNQFQALVQFSDIKNYKFTKI